MLERAHSLARDTRYGRVSPPPAAHPPLRAVRLPRLTRCPRAPQHWVFWLGPYLGATSAAICYTYLFQHELFHAKTIAAAAAAAPASGGAAPSAELKAQPAPVAVFTTRNDGAVEAVESRLPASADTGSEWR